MDNELLLLLKVALVLLFSVSSGILITALLRNIISDWCKSCNCVRACSASPAQPLDPNPHV
jgi:hypothetical protein